jgi:hypothetical protein
LECPTEIASVDSGRLVFAHIQRNCLGWTISGAASNTGLVVIPQGTATVLCSVPRPVACCLTPYLETFRGITAGTYTGAIGGRAAAHAICAAQYPGSHLCHSAEYERAASTVPLPATGAWTDMSTFQNFSEPNAAMPGSGRLIVNTINGNCENWTNALNSRVGMTVATPMPVTQQCNIPRPLACCGG